MKKLLFALIIFTSLSLQCTGSVTDTIKVRLLSSLERITKYENFEPDINLNISAARNEWVEFQIAVRSESDSVKKLLLRMSDLISPEGHVINANIFTDYRLHFVEIEEKSNWIITGPKTKLFEKEFAAYIGVKHAIATNSGDWKTKTFV